MMCAPSNAPVAEFTVIVWTTIMSYLIGSTSPTMLKKITSSPIVLQAILIPVLSNIFDESFHWSSALDCDQCCQRGGDSRLAGTTCDI